ncbi:GntR family transcriptional regulator [Suicoccus acidiformans]|uniref:GntR family transcriptional regulator n=1 Tax=Suicoccus acidiformans TaxID=2036206 RepID=A0A347WMC9_9LACT|nr:GntR family transcriptional regulator [Suicoccus acidiformans]AXY26236.1 GntR family transcriptional regulator [Suicoccus acidiformans]
MIINLNKKSKIPLYEQIISEIKRNILTEKIKSNEQLPSIRKLAKSLDVSVITVKNAYDNLETEGYIETVSGRGSYVAELNQDLLKEKVEEKIKDYMTSLVIEAHKINMSKEALIKILEDIYEKEN